MALGFFSGIGATNCSIGQALANDTLERLYGAGFIVHAQRDAVVIAEIIFAQIAVKVLFIAMLIDALHAALEDREIAFNGIGVSRRRGHIPCAVHDGFMRGDMRVRALIEAAFIGVQAAFAGDVRDHDLRHGRLVGVLDMEGADADRHAQQARQSRALRAALPPLVRARPRVDAVAS